jgi:hypothetical protein
MATYNGEVYNFQGYDANWARLGISHVVTPEWCWLAWSGGLPFSSVWRVCEPQQGQRDKIALLSRDRMGNLSSTMLTGIACASELQP